MVVKNNVKLVIDSDAPHHPVNLAFLRFGIAQVRRGGQTSQIYSIHYKLTFIV